jgi:hypothetical protein
MGSTPATGNGPFEFTDALGRQWSIPISAITFNQSQAALDSTWTAKLAQNPAANASAIATASLSYAAKEGYIAPAPTPSPFAAMVLQAATAGAAGNNISVQMTISDAIASPPTDDPTLTQFSLTVTETDTYTGLTAATIQSQLSGQGGLVQVAPGFIDTAGAPDATTGNLTGSPAQLQVMGTGSPALVFTLAAKKTGADGLATKVAITPDSSPPSSGQETFTLVATWTKTASGITLGTLESTVAGQLGYEITVSKPSSGAYSVPAGGITTTLSGGAPGVNASATLFTGQ